MITKLDSAKEAIFLQGLLKETGGFNRDTVPIYSDNNGALLLAQNPVFHVPYKTYKCQISLHQTKNN
jgi:hypothetical protein